MPWKREPEAVNSLPCTIEGETIVSKGCQPGSKPRPGSYSSALLKAGLLFPAATSTLPLGSSVAVCAPRAVPRLPVVVQVPLARSYSSALLKPEPVDPPATSTLPLASPVAGSSHRAVTRLPLAGPDPLPRSYSSALLKPELLDPPATSTLPLGSSVAV